MLHQIALTSAQYLLFVAHPVAGAWSDLSSQSFEQKLWQLQHKLEQLQQLAKAIDTFALVPGV